MQFNKGAFPANSIPLLHGMFLTNESKWKHGNLCLEEQEMNFAKSLIIYEEHTKEIMSVNESVDFA